MEGVGEGLWIKLGLDAEGLKSGLEETKQSLTEWRDETNASTRDLAAWGTAIMAQVAPVVAVGAGMYALAANAGKYGDEIRDNARDIGMSTDEYQRWVHVGKAVGTTTESMVSSLRAMSLRLEEAQDPTSEVGKLLQDLGVDVKGTDGKMRSMNDILLDLFPALGRLPAGFERNQAAMKLFGKNFKDIGDLTETTKENIDDLLDQAPVISEEKLENMDNYNTRLALLNEKLEMAYVEIGEKLVPVLENSLIPAFEAAMPVIQDMIGVLDYLGEAVDRAASGYAMLADPGNWQTTISAFNARQAKREWSRRQTALEEEVATNPHIGGRIIDVSGGTSAARQGQGVTIGDKTIYITINNPKGTAQENASAIRQAGRDLARELT